MQPIEKLIELYGNQNKAAINLGISRALFNMWKKQGFIPYNRGKDIENKTDGKIKASEIWEAAAIGKNHTI